jgi:hypothetical protein
VIAIAKGPCPTLIGVQGEHEAGELVKAGFLAQSPTGDGCTATFDHITFTRDAPADLRDGS